MRDVKPWRERGQVLVLGHLQFSFNAGGSQERHNERARHLVNPPFSSLWGLCAQSPGVSPVKGSKERRRKGAALARSQPTTPAGPLGDPQALCEEQLVLGSPKPHRTYCVSAAPGDHLRDAQALSRRIGGGRNGAAQDATAARDVHCTALECSDAERG